MLAGDADAVGLGVTSESHWSPANCNPCQGFPGEEGDRGSSQQERGGKSKAQEGHKWYLEAARIRLDKQVGLVNERVSRSLTATLRLSRWLHCARCLRHLWRFFGYRAKSMFPICSYTMSPP